MILTGLTAKNIVMGEIFVSYASADRARVQPLISRLTAEGWSVWWDRQIDGGALWDTQIEQQLDGARCVLVLWSADAVASDWVRSEAIEAHQANKLLPVLLENVRLPLMFRRLQARNLVGWPQAHDPHELDKLITDVRQQLGRSVPRPRAAAPPTERSERRHVTLLQLWFSGLEETQQLEPDEMHDFVRTLETALRAAAVAAGGLLLQVDVTGCAVAFGVTATSEDDEVNAAETAFRLRAVLPPLAGGGRIGLCMGLASGTAIVAPGATPGAPRLTGNVTLQATALARQAQTGQLLVGAATQRRLAPYFATAARGADVFELRERTAVRNRIDAARAVGLSAWVNRHEERESLEVALEAAIRGEGRAVCLIGEAGMGKSRLIHEFVAAAGDRDIVVVEGRCVPQGRTSSYGPFSQVLREILRLGQLDPAELETAAKRRMLELDPALEPYLAQLLFLLGVRSDAHPLPDTLEGAALRRSLGETIIAVLSLASGSAPIVLVLEDWQWADEASRDLLPRLVELCASLHLLIVACARSEAAPQWPPLVHCQQLVLRALSKATVGELACSICRAERIEPTLATLLHARSDGVPLFVEELARELLDTGVIGVDDGTLALRRAPESLALPESVEAVVRSRLDRLDAEVLELARVAAVIGRQFGSRLLEDLIGAEDSGAATVADGLGVLVAQGLVQQVRVVPEAEYRFRHLTTQLVAYDSLLVKRRRALHLRVGELIEARDAANLDERLELLAHHFVESGADDKAIEYLMQAGQRAIRNVAHTAAEEYLGRAVEMLERKPESAERDELLLRACVSLGNVRILIKGYAAPEVVQVYERARALSRSAPVSPSRFACLWMLWRYFYNRALIDQAAEFAKAMEGQAIADPGAHKSGMLSSALAAEGVVQFFRARFAEARVPLRRVAEFGPVDGEREHAFRFGMSPCVHGLAFLGMADMVLGDVESALAASAQAVAIARQLGHPGSLALALQYRCIVLTTLEEFAASGEHSDELAALATRHELRHWLTLARMQRGIEMMMSGDVAAGFAQCQQYMTAVEALGVRMATVQHLIVSATAALLGGRIEEGQGMMSQAEREMDNGNMRVYAPDVARIRARLRWAADPAGGREEYARALALCARLGARLTLLRTAAEFATLLADTGALDDARRVLREAWDSFPPSQRGARMFTRIGAQLSALERGFAEPREQRLPG